MNDSKAVEFRGGPLHGQVRVIPKVPALIIHRCRPIKMVGLDDDPVPCEGPHIDTITYRRSGLFNEREEEIWTTEDVWDDRV